jgi:transposase
MRPAQYIAESALMELERLLKTSTSKSQMQRIQCVLLRARQGMNCNEVAAVVGWNAGWVRQVWATYLRSGIMGLVCQERGGRRRSNLSLEQESALVGRFAETACAGGILVVSDIHSAYENEVGHPVPKSTIYRMLSRHGWRKVAPRPHHPKNDPAACADFKKNSRKSLRENAKGKHR